MLETEFAKIGLNKNEREVYLAVLRSGKIPHERVARSTGINRTTVYSIARKLANLGLITEDLGAKVAYLIAEKPEAITRIFKREEDELQKRKAAAEKLASGLSSYRANEEYSVPRIKFIEEEDLNEYLYREYPAWAESGARDNNMWWGYHDHSFTESYKKWIDWIWKQTPEMKVRVFSNEAKIEEKMQKKYPERVVKPIGKEGFDSSLWVIGDYIIMCRSRERPHYLVEIHDPVLARNQRQLFKNLWEKVR
jgi:sugar-specific transcriptional regulator TrmB